MKYQRPKGTADILPGESVKWQYVEATARQIFEAYRFAEIRTPMFESYEVFSRSSGETSDIVTKEMYDFEDKGGRHLALRPEGTAGVVRAFVENKLYGPEFNKPYKVYYMGPMFRYERPQSGRQREFHQIGVEAFGSESPALDVEVIAMALNLLQAFKIGHLKLALNTLGDPESRQAYHEALVNYLKPHFDELSEDSKVRLEKNPLRVLDSKDKKDQAIVKGAPSILDFLTDSAKAHFDEVKQLLGALNIDYVIDPTMVRGLDYYNHTIFEIMTTSPAFGDKEMTVIAGGRYDGLVHELGGPEVSGFGFGCGLERLLLLLNEQVTKQLAKQLAVYVVGIGTGASEATLKMVQAIRQQGFSADRDYLDRKPKAQFKSADRNQAAVVITIGEDEIKNKTAQVKDMATGIQKTLPVATLQQDFQKVYTDFRNSEGK
ncbi:histidyl-tRNA synthetase [Agrilactobacillus composti DSM 18527 = JCM 14202]|uniref:Histidine--tRNA ligase n=1 Tax=Agrilactobacillus composti DSM 18527 = JCM 14202 TaxID=1423734 RepID=A0A0R1Y028_9LACO|nr:histidine--tRNA ligase [Agrilactobacillus composti]KRM33465.1 histidyl-tRNA synthetase [Agrilactobacillus composti DSM 18527 = JCM 14202]